jgi:glycine dehydrogenase subunit 1
MGSFIPATADERQEMLKESGYSSFDELYKDIPDSVKLKNGPDMPSGMSEMEAQQYIENLSEENIIFKHCFRGAGAYRHYIPAIVKRVTSKETFLTAYTPYQAEISQGILQSIFEYQSMICAITGMDVSNASVYDGSSSAAESALMCIDRRKTRILLSAALPERVLTTVKTYCHSRNASYSMVPEKDGKTDIYSLTLVKEDACLLIASPNKYGIIEDERKAADICHASGSKLIVYAEPTSLGILETPGECGADIACGEAQPLGMPLSWGGPYLGYMAVKADLMRKLPGRIVGETKDNEGRRAFVLTLQAREQHIRREKASSNICSNEALCALTASVYLAALGKKGFRDVAVQCYSKAHYLCSELDKIGLRSVFSSDFYNEFVTESPNSAKILSALENKGYLGGLPIDDSRILWCTTEVNSKNEIDELVSIIKEVI